MESRTSAADASSGAQSDAKIANDLALAAVELFAVQGYANTSVQEIADAAGVSKATMYRSFESKDDLLFGIYDRLLSLQQARLDEVVERGGDVNDMVRDACVGALETAIAHLQMSEAFFRSLNMLSLPRQREVRRRRRLYHDTFAGLIARGQAEGVYRTDIPLTILVAHFYSDLHYLSYWYSPDGPDSAAVIAERLTELYLTSLRGPHPAS